MTQKPPSDEHLVIGLLALLIVGVMVIVLFAVHALAEKNKIEAEMMEACFALHTPAECQEIRK